MGVFLLCSLDWLGAHYIDHVLNLPLLSARTKSVGCHTQPESTSDSILSSIRWNQLCKSPVQIRFLHDERSLKATRAILGTVQSWAHTLGSSQPTLTLALRDPNALLISMGTHTQKESTITVTDDCFPPAHNYLENGETDNHNNQLRVRTGPMFQQPVLMGRGRFLLDLW